AGYFNRDYSDHTNYSGSVPAQRKDNGFDYNQQVLYGDMSLSFPIVSDVNLTCSCKAERLTNKGSFVNETTVSPLDYKDFNLNPNIRLNTIFRSVQFELQYSNRVSRPDISYLNPFEDVSNPYFIKRGNPNLKGQSTDYYSLYFKKSFSSKWLDNIHITLSYIDQHNLIGPFTTVQDDGVSISSYCNTGKASSFSSYLGGRILFGKKIDIYITANYTRSSFMLSSGRTNDYSYINPSFRANWSPRYFYFFTELRMPPRSLNSQSSKVYSDPDLTVSLSRYFKKPKIGFAIEGHDLLRSGGRRETQYKDTNFSQRCLTDSYGRYLLVRVYWRIGAFRETKSVDVGAYDM
nr:outer membrane beta-barrel family protein [Bacteroidales bacterium]